MGIEMSTEIDHIDIENYRFDGNTYELPKVKTKKVQCYEPTTPFFTTPFIAAMPRAWIAEAAKLPGHALHVALAIMYVYGMDREKKVVLTRFHFDIFSTKRNAARSSIDALQEAGLIEYTKDGHKYIITVIPTESK